MKILQNGKLFGKISIIDIIIIIVAIVLLYGVFEKYKNNIMPSTASHTNYTEFKYVIRIEDVLKETENALKIDDIVIDSISNTQIGKISDIKVSPYVKEFKKLDGEVLMKEVPERYSIDVTINTIGTVENNEYLANGLIKTLVGEKKKIKTKYFEKIVFVTSINKVEE